MKKRVSPKSIADIVSSSPIIKELRQEAKKLEHMQMFISSFVDAELMKKITIGAVGTDFIVLIADSPAWAAKIRYIVPQILENLNARAEYAAVNTIRIRTQKHDRPPPILPTPHRLTLGSEAASALKETANSIEDDEIAKALKRLSRHST